MSVVPVWIDAPATGGVPPPPVDTLDQTLPFGLLAWEDFERLALRLIRREADVLDCAIYGTPGQNQEGIDIVAVLRNSEGDQRCYQCKRVSSFSPSDIRDAVAKFLEGRFAQNANALVLCVSIPLQRREQLEAIELQREILRSRGISLLTWDGSEGGLLAEKLKAAPDLVDDFFGREWVRRFNGHSAADSLGTRLDGIDQAKLLQRLRALYVALFNQFDPGPRVPGGACASFTFRYVQPDALRTVWVEGSKALANREMTAAGDVQQELPQSSNAASTFETRLPITEWLRQRAFGTILGHPGYGKSAFLKFLTLAILDADKALEGVFDSEQLTRIPVWFSFAAFSSAIQRDFSTSVSSYFTDWLRRNGFEDVTAIVERALRSSRLLLLVDGLDEAAGEGNARIALDRLVAFVESTNSNVICTSRPIGFDALGVPTGWEIAELAPLSDLQIAEIAQKSIALSNETPATTVELEEALERAALEANRYLAAVRSNESTHQLARTPLLCLALLDLFRQSPRLPEDRVSIYRQIIDLLIARHPGQRARAADSTSAQSQGIVKDADLKRMLGKLAMSMQNTKSVTVTRPACIDIFVDYLKDEHEGLGRPHGEARQIADSLVDSLIGRLGIIVERSPEEYAFAHLSLQEFLAAEAIALCGEDVQLRWVGEHWSSPFGREVALNWFGIQGALGRKEFASRAGRLIVQQSNSDRFARMRALELLAELAVSDLGLPVRDAREFVSAAFHEIRTSPFSEYRESLARLIALGAIASAVRDECREGVRRMVPGRSEHFRANILEKLRSWGGSSDLAEALFQSILDESSPVRRAGASTLAEVPWAEGEVKDRLVALVATDLRPEVKAAALHALRLNPSWLPDALIAGRKCVDPRSPELLLEVISLRIAEGTHTTQDLETLVWIWEGDFDFWARPSLFECILSGWRGTPELRSILIDKARNGERSDTDEVLALLAEARPGDSEVANLVADHFADRLSLGLSRDALWPALIKGFKGHPTVAPVVWEALLKQIKADKRIIWHPSFTPAFIVVGTDEARNALITAYAEADDVLDRYWIAKTLIDGWPDDQVVAQHLGEWFARPDPAMSAPLASWIYRFVPEPGQRRQWLIDRAKTAPRRLTGDVLLQLLDEFPDQEVLAICEARLQDEDIWYFRRVALEAKLASAAPGTGLAKSVFERAVGELDGPPIGPLVAAAEHVAEWRRRLLDAAVPSALGVRQAVVSVFRERVAPDVVLDFTIPEPLAEVSGPVRTTVLCALAGANKSRVDPKRAARIALLTPELKAVGPYYESRRLSAAAAFSELGEFDLAATALMQKDRGLSSLLSTIRPDPIAVQTLLGHLDSLEAAAQGSGNPLQLGSAEVWMHQPGMIDTLATDPHFAALVDKKLREPLPNWDAASILELAAAHWNGGDLLLRKLIEAISGHYDNYAVWMSAAKLLARYFGGRDDVWQQIQQAMTSRMRSKMPSGVAAHLVLGWPGEAAFLRSFLPTRSPLDELVFGTLDGDSKAASEALVSVLQLHRPQFWRHLGIGQNLLLEWAALPAAQPILSGLAMDDNGTTSMLSVELLSRIGATSALPVEELKIRFSYELSNARWPREGFDIFTARYRSWCSAVFATLYGVSRRASRLHGGYTDIE